jgi:hypothetical protein
VIEMVVCTSHTREEASCPVPTMRFSLDDCSREELFQWVCQSIAFAVKQYFEMRAKGEVRG